MDTVALQPQRKDLQQYQLWSRLLVSVFVVSPWPVNSCCKHIPVCHTSTRAMGRRSVYQFGQDLDLLKIIFAGSFPLAGTIT
eukprot:5524695-Amphidinium_carterae.1